MLSLIEHATDGRPPAPTSWLLAGSVAAMMLSLILIMRALQDFDRMIRIYAPVTGALIAGAVVALIVGWLRPAPLLLVLTLSVLLGLIWFFAVDRWLRHGQEP